MDLKFDPSYRDLKDIRKKRGDFDIDAPNPTPRTHDITEREESQDKIAWELRAADKYIAYLQGKVNDLKNENADLKNKVASSMQTPLGTPSPS